MKIERNCLIDYNRINTSVDVVIGSEICPIKLISEYDQGLYNEILTSHKSIRFVTPIVPCSYIEQIYTIISKLPMGSKVTFNDWGLFYKCIQLLDKRKLKPVLGRILTHSLIDCPWYENIIKNENSYVQKILNLHNMHSKLKVEFLKEYKIEELEINNCPNESLDYFHINGIKVTQYKDYNILSVSRTCFYAKLSNFSTEICRNNMCTCKLLNVDMLSFYSTRHRLLQSNLNSIIDWNDIMLFGNALFIKNNKINENVDHLIE